MLAPPVRAGIGHGAQSAGMARPARAGIGRRQSIQGMGKVVIDAMDLKQ